MSKHTPGPWAWDCGDIGETYSIPYADIYDEKETIIASFNNLIPEGKHNASLIASAPDLLEALKLYQEAGFGNSTDYHKQGLAYDAAVEAIAKAESQS